MSERVKASGEQSAESMGNAGHLEVLTEMSDKFDPEKAKEQREKDKPQEAEKSAKAEKTTHLQVMAEKVEKKAVEELTPEEASKEYLDLLMDLSADFTSAEGKSSRAASYGENGNLQVHNRGYGGREKRIVGQIYETATGKDLRDEERKFKDGKWEDAYLDRELALGMADDIIAAESDWRAAGESTTLETEQAEQADLEEKKKAAQEKLDKIEHGIFGKLKKAFYVNFRNKEYNQLYNQAHREPKTQAKAMTERASSRLQKALEAAYSEDYGYGHHELSYEHTARDGSYADKINTEYNEKFFDPAKKEKIDRAIALRRKLQADEVVKR